MSESNPIILIKDSDGSMDSDAMDTTSGEPSVTKNSDTKKCAELGCDGRLGRHQTKCDEHSISDHRAKGGVCAVKDCNFATVGSGQLCVSHYPDLDVNTRPKVVEIQRTIEEYLKRREAGLCQFCDNKIPQKSEFCNDHSISNTCPERQREYAALIYALDNPIIGTKSIHLEGQHHEITGPQEPQPVEGQLACQVPFGPGKHCIFPAKTTSGRCWHHLVQGYEDRLGTEAICAQLFCSTPVGSARPPYWNLTAITPEGACGVTNTTCRTPNERNKDMQKRNNDWFPVLKSARLDSATQIDGDYTLLSAD
ncbi:hypothetical protein SCUP515_03349 [Seiridium cupressi]